MAARSYQFGNWLVEPGANRILSGTTETHLEPVTMDVLCHLLEHPGDTVSTEHLLEAVWNGKVVESNAVPRAINQIRRALGDDPRAPRFIETIRKRGYRTIADVAEMESGTAGPKAAPVDQSTDNRTLGAGPWPLLLALVLLITVATTVWWMTRTPFAMDANPPTIAVLPFENLSRSPADAYFSAAVTREIWSALTRVKGLRVISMTSARAVADEGLDVRSIGQRLTANYLVEGSAMKSDQLVRVNVHLIDAASGHELWSRPPATEQVVSAPGMFGLFGGIAADLVAALREANGTTLHLDGPTEPPVTSNAALELLQRAKFEYDHSWNLRYCLQLAEQAVELDDESWRAHDDLAGYLHVIAEFGLGPSREYLERAMKSANRSLALAPPGVGDPYVTRGILRQRVELDFRAALRDFEMAQEIGATPDFLAAAMQDLYLNAGAYELGLPLLRDYASRNPGLGLPELLLGRFLIRMGRVNEGYVHLERALELQPDHVEIRRQVLAHYVFGSRIGDLGRAKALVSELGIADDPAFERLRALIAFFEGDPEPLRRYTNRLIGGHAGAYARPATISHDLYLLGDIDAHLDWFQVRVQELDLLSWLKDQHRRPRFDGYWENLEAWADADPSETEHRHARLEAHRALMNQVTQKMVL